MATLGEVGETRLIEWLVKNFSGQDVDVVVGNGHDAAVVNLCGNISLKVDTFVLKEVPKPLSYYDVGWKSIMACASDLAAVGSRPRYALVSFSGPRSTKLSYFEEIFKGIGDALSVLDSTLLGGDLSETSELCLSISMLGKMAGSPLLRKKAKPGDIIAVSKTFGLEPLGLRILYKKISVGAKLAKMALEKFRHPHAEVEYGAMLSELGFVSSCSDSSDGLILAIRELIDRNTDAVIDKLPIDQALNSLNAKIAKQLTLYGGEEYALIYTYDPSKDDELVNALKKINRDRIVIGEVRAGRGEIYLQQDERLKRLEIRGWRQFQSRPLRIYNIKAKKR